MLQVADTGTGIPPEVLARLWEPFVTTKGPGKGTGLGLSTVRGIVNHHGAFVQLDTVPGAGSSFRVFFPAVLPPVPAGATTVPDVPGHGELILIVDDEPPVRDMISLMLTRQGYRVLIASDGAEAAASFAKYASEIKLVISDLNMPNLDGAMLSKVLKRMNPDVRVLIVSGLDLPGTSRSPLGSDEFRGAFLRKPFKGDELIRKTSELLRGLPPVAS
jgi:CheY-like chemotaxis protein